MANEYRIAHVSAEVVRDGPATANTRIAHISAEVTRDGPDTAAAQIAHISAEVIHEGLATNEIQIAFIAIEVVRSPWIGVWLDFLDPDDEIESVDFVEDWNLELLDVDLIYPVNFEEIPDEIEFNLVMVNPSIDDDLLFTVDYEPTGIPIQIPEFNPYRPTIPNEYYDLDPTIAEFHREQTETLRQQSNLIYAGDSHLPWQLLVQLSREAIVRLGSIGRFFHPDYGIILARYVRFRGLEDTLSVCVPVGLMNVSPKVDWVVTNQLERSNDNLVVGMVAAFETPEDGDYGWAIVNGVNIQPVYTTDSNGDKGEAFSWGETGQLSLGGTGRIIARRVGTSNLERFEIGELKIELESANVTGALVQLGAFDEQLAALGVRVGTLESDTTTVLGLSTQLAALQTALTLETSRRSLGDNAIRSQIDAAGYVTSTELSAALTSVNLTITGINTTLTIAVGTAQARADAAYALAASITPVDLTTLNSQVALLTSQVNLLLSEPITWIPVTDGATPPELIYLDDGTLVYDEIYR